MRALHILSAGAAQAVTERIVDAFRRDTSCEVVAQFGAVGAMKSKLGAGDATDVIILTRAMIDELEQAGIVERGSRVDLGTVSTGVAVPKSATVPDVQTSDSLRNAILDASAIVCPDPAIATAGKVVLALMEKLGIAQAVEARLRFFPNGYAAMRWLAESGGAADMGITQVTEILPNNGVTYAGPLPAEHQMKTVYSAALVSRAAEPALARELLNRYSGDAARVLLREAGYEAG
jgi:molybdate transport system substrate-binding protein